MRRSFLHVLRLSLAVACALSTAVLCLWLSNSNTGHISFLMAYSPWRENMKRNSSVEEEVTNSSFADSPQPEVSSEIRQVIFIKVHKAASSTVQNVMLRFSLARNLSVLLPKDPNSHLNEMGRKIFPERIIPNPQGQPFDMLCDHIIFDEEELAPYFPETAVRVTILREPMQQALSALVYFSQVYKRRDLLAGIEKYKNAPLEGFLGHPQDFRDPTGYVGSSYINNRMSVDLGFNLTNFEAYKKNKTKIHDFVRQLEHQFDLILIADYFDESMVLLRRTLNWSMKDVMYLEVNTASGNLGETPKSTWSNKPVLNSTILLAFRKWAAVDYALYHNFLVKFLNKIEAEDSFMEEVAAFREARDEVASFCLRSAASDGDTSGHLSVSATPWTEAFTLTTTDCRLMTMHERDLFALAGERQMQRYRLSTDNHSI